jgi:glycosyltransferase involved in cell wall biosynthesis
VSDPLVSVITATYNRSQVLACAIRSLERSTFADWELIVVSDACTDDTREVVASFAEPRIRFVDLERNTGEQSGPNNEGFRHCRGRFIAYLNHDDLWLVDHLETALRGIERSGADLVFTLALALGADGSRFLLGATPSGRYEPHMSVPASTWLLRRELVSSVGPWRHFRETYNVPSQEWLFRAWKAGKSLRLVPRLTVVALPSGSRRGSYLGRESPEHRAMERRILEEPDFREVELTELGRRYAARAEEPAVLRNAARAASGLFAKLCLLGGVHPRAAINLVAHRRKGGAIDRKRRVRGLGEVARRSAS